MSRSLIGRFSSSNNRMKRLADDKERALFGILGALADLFKAGKFTNLTINEVCSGVGIEREKVWFACFDHDEESAIAMQGFLQTF